MTNFFDLAKNFVIEILTENKLGIIFKLRKDEYFRKSVKQISGKVLNEMICKIEKIRKL